MDKEQIVKLAAEAAVSAAMNYLAQQSQKEKKSRHDKRLRNTKLLLDNYSLLQDHCANAVYDKHQIIEANNAIDVLDSIENCDKDMYIESIKKSTVRTKIILSHIDEMLNLYKTYYEKSKREENNRRYRILRAFYFEDSSILDIVKREKIDERTYYHMKDAREKLSALIFGIDGLHNLS